MTHFLPTLALVLLAVTAAVVLWGLLSPVQSLPVWSHKRDKLLHAIAFAVFAVLASLSWPGVHRIGLWLLLVLAGLVSEGLPHLTPDRRFCWRDATANAIGAALGLGLVAFFSAGFGGKF